MGHLYDHRRPRHVWLAFCWRELTFCRCWTGHRLHNRSPFWRCNSQNFGFNPSVGLMRNLPTCVLSIVVIVVIVRSASPNFCSRDRESLLGVAFVGPCPMGGTYRQCCRCPCLPIVGLCWSRRAVATWSMLIRSTQRPLPIEGGPLPLGFMYFWRLEAIAPFPYHAFFDRSQP
jgi:hypothetical protein